MYLLSGNSVSDYGPAGPVCYEHDMDRGAEQMLQRQGIHFETGGRTSCM